MVTTRFPVAANRVYEEFGEEYETWVREKRLHVVGLDLRDLVSVERFCSYVKNTFERVDCIVNNACQTVRRPASYYKETVEKEREGGEGKECLRLGEELEEMGRRRERERIEGGEGAEKPENGIGGVSLEVVGGGSDAGKEGGRRIAKVRRAGRRGGLSEATARETHRLPIQLTTFYSSHHPRSRLSWRRYL